MPSMSQECCFFRETVNHDSLFTTTNKCISQLLKFTMKKEQNTSNIDKMI